MGGMAPIHWSVHAALTRWQGGPFALATIVVLVAVAGWYLRAEWILASRGRRWPPTRTVAFLAGLGAIEVAIGSPVAAFTASYFEAHVIQHLLLMVVAPPLLALGAPSTLLLQTSSRRLKTTWLSVLKSRPFALLTFPVTVWALYFGLMFGFFLSSLVNTAMTHMWLMDTLNVAFLFGATLYWWPMVGLDPIVHWRMGYGARMVNILLGGPPEVILGLALLSAHTPVASMYSLSSTHAGGGLLWVSTEAATLIGFIPIFWQWIRSDERAGSRADVRAEREDAALAAAAAGAAATAAVTPAEAAADAQVEALLAAAATQPAGGPTSDVSEWEAYWKMRTGRVPGRSRWTPNRPG